MNMNVTDISAKPTVFAMVLTLGIPIVTILANVPAIILIVWSICRKQLVKNAHLMSVGITDTLVGITALLMAEAYLNRTNSLSYYNCCLRYYCFSITFVASMLHVLGICVQRVRIIFRKDTPQQHEQYRRLTEWLVIAMSWVVSLLVNAIPFGLWVEYRDINYCSFHTVHGENSYNCNIYVGVLYCVVMIMALLAMGILVGQICCKGRFHTNQTLGAKDVKLCVTIIIMAFLFVATTTPLSFILMTNQKSQEVRSIAVLISLVNSTINPFVYLYRIKENRNRLRNAICCYSQSSCCKPATVNVENTITANTT